MKQRLLYTICAAAWNLCSKYIANFSAFKAFYTPLFINSQLKAIVDAETLPGILQTNKDSTNARVDLTISVKLVMLNWQSLKAYIQNAFIPEKVDIMLEAAGASLYKKTSRDNWNGTRSLIDAANKFIQENIAVLSANDNMPATFPAKFQADADDCIALITAYADADMAKKMATNTKVDANNFIYAALVRLVKDAAIIFREDVAIKKQFTIRYLMAVNGGEGSASLSGYVKDENKNPVAGALISSINAKYQTTADGKGRYSISRISAESVYNFTVSAPGYEPVSQEISFTPGTATRANFSLVSIKEKVTV